MIANIQLNAILLEYLNAIALCQTRLGLVSTETAFRTVIILFIKPSYYNSDCSLVSSHVRYACQYRINNRIFNFDQWVREEDISEIVFPFNK